MRRSGRARRAPERLDTGGDETGLHQAMRRSLLEQARAVLELPEAPVFRPTAAEFGDPLAYIGKIQSRGVLSGIAKIIPPQGWKLDFNLDIKEHFVTKRQHVHTLQEGFPFGEGREYSQQSYKEYARLFKEAWLHGHPEVQVALAEADDSAAAQARVLEAEYWRLVERVSEDEVIVDYANDIDTETYGSAFTSGAGAWDLRHLYSTHRSVLRKLGFSVQGLTYPWLYFGALFATFCWHVEDHFLYSLNYLHTGAPKTWYGVPGSHAKRLEEAMRCNVPARFQEERDLLHHLVVAAPPSLLAAQGVHVVHAVQEPGEFIVTFPRAFHSGFSHGWNCAEAVNFASLDWLPFGAEAVQHYSKGPGKRPAVFSHDKLVWQLAGDAIDAARTADLQPVPLIAPLSVPLRINDVSSIVPIRPYGGALRASLQQRAPTAVRDYAAQQVVPVPAQHGKSDGKAVSLDDMEVDTSSEHSSEDYIAPYNALGALVDAAAAVKVESGTLEAHAEDMVLESIDALTVLADTVATESTPPTFECKSEPKSAGAMAAVDAVSLLTAMVTEAISTELVAANVDFTAQELQLLAAELERRTDPELVLRDHLRKEKVQESSKAAELVQTDGDLPACRECGAIPFLSYIRCSCSQGDLRCLEHAHIGCICPWPAKVLYQRVTDNQLQSTRAQVRGLANKGEAIMKPTAVAPRRLGHFLTSLQSHSREIAPTATVAMTGPSKKRPSAPEEGEHLSARAKKASMRSQLTHVNIASAVPPSRKSPAAGAAQPPTSYSTSVPAAQTGGVPAEQALDTGLLQVLLPAPEGTLPKQAKKLHAPKNQPIIQSGSHRESSNERVDSKLPPPFVQGKIGNPPPQQAQTSYRRAFCPTPVTTGSLSQGQVQTEMVQAEVAPESRQEPVAAELAPSSPASASSVATTSGGEAPEVADQLASSASCNPCKASVSTTAAIPARHAGQQEGTVTQVAKAAHSSAIAAKTAASEARAVLAAAKAALSSPRGFYEQQRGASWSIQAAALGRQPGAPPGVPPPPATGHQQSSLSSGLVQKVLQHVNADMKMSNAEVGEPLILRDLPYVPSRKSKMRTGVHARGEKNDANRGDVQTAASDLVDTSTQVVSTYDWQQLEWENWQEAQRMRLQEQQLQQQLQQQQKQEQQQKQQLQQQLQQQQKQEQQQQKQQHQVHVLAHSAAIPEVQADIDSVAIEPPVRLSMLAGLTASVRTIAQQKTQKHRSAELAQMQCSVQQPDAAPHKSSQI